MTRDESCEACGADPNQPNRKNFAYVGLYQRRTAAGNEGGGLIRLCNRCLEGRRKAANQGMHAWEKAALERRRTQLRGVQ